MNEFKMTLLKPQLLAVPRDAQLADLEAIGAQLATQQRGINWWIGDLARYGEQNLPDTWQQLFPEWMSPGLIARCKAVAEAYPNEADRHPDCTWTQHMQVANKSDRQETLAVIAEEGLTSDESRRPSQKPQEASGWLLAVDCNYHVHRHWYSGAGVEAATQVAGWIERLVGRLKEKGLTDCVCCFDSTRNIRREMTAEWEDKYKDRPQKELELTDQIAQLGDLLHASGFHCAVVDGWEADDVIATYCAKFNGRVTILSQDKDLRQCLSDRVNMLLDVEWIEDHTTGHHLPDYKWMSAKQHTEATGIRPDQWADFQAIAGDNVDGIKGAVGIGEKGATDLIKQFGSLDDVIEAAKAQNDDIRPKKREALLKLSERLDAVRQLVTMRTDLEVSANTKVI